MKYVFLTASLLSFFVILPTATLALDIGSTGTIFTGGSLNLAPALNLGTINIVDTLHMNVSFSSPVEIDTLKLKITKQGDNSTLKIMSLSGSKTDDHVVDIVLGTDLQQGSAYTLTAVSAIGKDRSVIKDGALALKDFVTPIPLKTPETEMSAAPNPNAVLVKTGSTTPVPTVSPTTTPTPQPTVTKKPDGVVPAKELPLTGMNPLFLLIIVLPIAYIFTRKRV